MGKIKAIIASVAVCVCVLCGCTRTGSMSFTFVVGTGDNIKVTLDTSDGLGLRQTDSGFAVTEEGNDILQAFFVEQAVYQQYVDVVTQEEGATINRQDSENGITFISYSYDGEAGMENNFIIWIEGTNTGVIAASLADLQTATGAFQSLSFSKE